MDYIVQRQKYLELLSWQGGGAQRHAYPPWKPLSSVSGGASTAAEDANDSVEMGAILQHLNLLKGLCSSTVSVNRYYGFCYCVIMSRRICCS